MYMHDVNIFCYCVRICYILALKLEFFVDQDNYIPGIADGVGIRVVIHNQTDMPLPDEQGFNLPPGTKTSIGLNRVMNNVLCICMNSAE